MEMLWYVFAAASVVCLASFVGLAIYHRRHKSKLLGVLSPLWIGSIGVALAGFLALYPVCAEALRAECGVWEALLGAVRGTIGLFVADGDFDAQLQLVGAPEPILRPYLIYLSLLIVAAPVLTFGFVLSFFENLRAVTRFVWQTHTRKSIYVFSELNDESLALAESVCKKDGPGRVIVFTDVHDREEETVHERIERAAKLDAILFRQDISMITVRRKRPTVGLYFFAIGTDATENLNQALLLIEKYRYVENSHLFVFSPRAEAEVVLSGIYQKSEDGRETQIRVRRVNEVRSLIHRTVYESGYRALFATAQPEADGQKHIRALVVGMGEHGVEMTKALTWVCQMDGYVAEIHCIDRDPMAESRFRDRCPELMMMNGLYGQPEETGYRITFHSGVDADSAEFSQLVNHLPRTTYAFVALGRDEKNVEVAVKLRMLFARKKYDTYIQAVMYDSTKKAALAGATNYKNQAYDVEYVGDRRSSYSEETILKSDLEDLALARHLKWGAEQEFWQYDYNYRSSIASAIHAKLRCECGIPGADKLPADRTEEELWAIRRLEHRRWNAYMRSEGYVFGGTVEREGRNVLAKTHNCLVPFSRLPLKEQEKDDD